jgi:NAD(P)-dependent dehydrogenase (short-subunit alcohol dehydrogenase family)
MSNKVVLVSVDILALTCRLLELQEALVEQLQFSTYRYFHKSIQQTILVHNAAISVINPLRDINANGSDSEVFKVYQLNVISIFQLTHFALPYLRQAHGTVLYVSSALAHHAVTGISLYCSTKASLNMFAKCMALEEPDITSIIVTPGMTDTDMQAQTREVADKVFNEEYARRFKEAKESGLLNKPEDVAKSFCAISILGTKEWSGEEIDWKNEKAQSMVNKLF